MRLFLLASTFSFGLLRSILCGAQRYVQRLRGWVLQSSDDSWIATLRYLIYYNADLCVRVINQVATHFREYSNKNVAKETHCRKRPRGCNYIN